MDACGTDLFCNLLGQFLGELSPLQVTLFRITFYFTLCFSFYSLGASTRSGKLDTESFINGIMYYINIQAFNAANIPENIDEDSQDHVKEAKARLARKIMPRVPT